MLYEVFLSHAEQDTTAAKALATWITSIFHVKVFTSTIPTGSDFHHEITAALRESKLAMLLATPNSLSRQWVHYEIGAINGLGKLLIPVCVSDIQNTQLPSNLRHLHACQYEIENDVRVMLSTIADVLGTERNRSAEVLASAASRPKLSELIGCPIPPEPAGVFTQRTDATQIVIRRILRRAGEAQQRVSFLGIAHSDLYGTNPVLNRHEQLKTAISLGATVRIIFQDPEAPAAERRARHEDGALDPREVIRHNIRRAEGYRARFPENFHICLTPDVSTYICFNHEEMVVTPYLNSATGHELASFWVNSRSALYQWAESHFDRLWGSKRWVLCDLGNVLIDFDHQIVSQQLIRYLPQNRKKTTTQAQIHDFIFGNQVSPSRNTLLDRGKKDLKWLHEEVCQHFAINLSYDAFHDVWMSIFASNLNQSVLDTLQVFHRAGLAVAICSNTNQEHWDGLCKRHSALRDLANGDEPFLSFEMGKVKTDDGFFDALTTRTTAFCEHHVLIDDRLDNCRAAEASGMYAVAFDSSDLPGSVRRTTDFISRQYWNTFAVSTRQ